LFYVIKNWQFFVVKFNTAFWFFIYFFVTLVINLNRCNSLTDNHVFSTVDYFKWLINLWLTDFLFLINAVLIWLSLVD
jgi:hypothetical protein